MRNRKKFFKPVGWILGLSLISWAPGCGKTSDSTLPPTAGITGGYVTGPFPVGTGGQCGSGPYSFSDPNCLTDFTSACTRVGGVVYANSLNTCAIPVGPVSVTSQTGILNPGDTSGPYSGRGLLVRAGDLISFYGSGSWGTADVSTGSFLKIFNYSWSSYDCNKVNAKGESDGGSTGTNQGLPMGLIGAVSGSSEAFQIGSYLSSYQIHNAGYLHIGMNAPANLAGICGSFSGTLYVKAH